MKLLRTPRQIEEGLVHGPRTAAEIEHLYATRAAFVERLSMAPSVTPEDLADLDRLGRFKVACTLWSRCTEESRAALLDDGHHSVRSAAKCALIDTGSAHIH